MGIRFYASQQVPRYGLLLGIGQLRARTEVAGEAARLGVPLVVGITEDATDDHFLNAQVVVTAIQRQSSLHTAVDAVPLTTDNR